MAGLGAFLLQAFWVKHYGFNLPWTDDWAVVPLLQHYHAGTLGLGELMAQHVDHRLFVARIVFVGFSALLGEWDLTAQMFFSAALAGTTVGLLVWNLRRLAVSAPAALLAGLVLMSPIQWENILWGFQVQFYLLVFFTVWAVSRVALTDRRGWRLFAGLAVLCFASTFSMGSGIFLWGIVLACIAIRSGSQWKQLVGFGDRGFRFGPLPAFLVAGVLCAVFYFRGYFQGAEEFKPKRIADFLWWCARAGSYPLLEKSTLWQSVLAVGQWLTIGAAVAGWWRGRADKTGRAKLVLVGGLLAFLLLNVAVTGYRRGAYLETAHGGEVPSRYATIFLWSAAIFVIAAGEILGRFRRPAGRMRWLAAGALVILTTSILVEHLEYGRLGIAKMDAGYRHKQSTAISVVNYLRDRSPDRQFHGPLPGEADQLKPFLDDPASVAELPRWLQARGADMPAQTTGEAWVLNGAFVARPMPDRRLVWGSWNSNDDLLGRLETEPIFITQPFLILPLNGFPSMEGNRLSIISENGRGEIVYPGPNAYDEWLEWRVDVSRFVGSKVRIVAVDGAKGPGGWLAFGVPWQRSRVLSWLDGPDALSGRVFAIAVLGCFVLMLVGKGGAGEAPRLGTRSGSSAADQ